MIKTGIFDIPPLDDPFWNKHIPESILFVSDCVTGDIPASEKLRKCKIFVELFCVNINNDIQKSGIIRKVRGNGYCGPNAVFAGLMKTDPLLSKMDYESLMENIRAYLDNHGFHTKNPSVIDAEYVCLAMKDFCTTCGIDGTTIIIIDIDNNNIIMNKILETSNPINTYILIYSSGHYDNLYVSEIIREQIFFCILSFKNDNPDSHILSDEIEYFKI